MVYKTLESFQVDHTPPGATSKFFLKIIEDGLGQDIHIPVFIARGVKPGPVLGLTAAVHGNEINGVRVIGNLIHDIESEIHELQGTIIAIPIVNTIGALLNQRAFNDDVDLNRIMPGKAKGNRSERFAYTFSREILKKLDYHIDLHTASFGRINSLYVRANILDKEIKKMALLQNPQIIVHNPARDSSVRGACAKWGGKSITVEVGNPQRIQKGLVKASVVGVHNLLAHLNMLPDPIKTADHHPIICRRSYWVYTKKGGILDVKADLLDKLKKGDLIATQYDMFGQPVQRYYAPEDGVVVGKSTNPVGQSGSRIIHIGADIEA